MTGLIQRLKGHAAGQRAVTYHSNRVVPFSIETGSSGHAKTC